MNRRLPALIGAAALITATLAGCSGAAGIGGCDPIYSSGDASSIVTATGSLGGTPKVDFPTPLVAKKTQVSVIEAGDGELIRDGQQVDYTQSIFYGKDGSKLSGDTVTKSRTAAGLKDSSLNKAMVCAHVGDRIAVTTTVKAAFGAGAGGQNFSDDETLVVVLDLNAAYRGKADGFNQLPQDNMPLVVTEVDGTPGISVTFVTKPTTTRVETVKAGDGAKVKKGDSVVVQLRAWTWPDKDQIDPNEILISDSSGSSRPINTWALHQAATVTLDGDQNGSLPPGVAKALIGVKAGSQLLVVVPPGDGHYKTIPSSLAGLTTDQTMIWVVDVLGFEKKQ